MSERSDGARSGLGQGLFGIESFRFEGPFRLGFPSNRGQLQRAVEEVVRTSLQADRIEVCEVNLVERMPYLPSGTLAMLREGKHIQTTEESPRQRRVLIPMRSRHELQAVLVVGAKPHSALYTNADLELLHIIASLAAVALHNAESIRLLEELRRLQVTAGHEEKLLALETLVFAIEHEFRTPLNFIKYFLTAVDKVLPAERLQDAELHQDIGYARDEVGFMERMVLGLKRRKHEPTWTEVAVLEVAQRVKTLLRDTLEGCYLDIDVPAELKVRGDHDMLLQVFANLLRNAAQAAGKGGEVSLRARQVNRNITIEVWDTGPGVPPEMESEIFKPYFTTTQGGTGLGLVITQRILNKFRWRISVHRENERTCFRIHAEAQDTASSEEVEAPDDK
jgi:signal transduction histidine kinase